MPKVPIDYSKTSIYKLVHKNDVDNENIYIGSTSNFSKRKNSHKSSCNNPKNHSYYNPKYVYIRENGGWDNWNIIEIEKYPCNDRREAETRERLWIEFYKSKLNKIIPTRTNSEYYKDNYEYYATYRENNKETINEKSKNYIQKNKDKIRETKKKYREENRDVIAEKQRKHYEKNKDKILEKQKEKITCECGCSVNRWIIQKHKRTAKHQKLMSELNKND